MRIVDVCAFYSPQGGGVRSYINRKLRAAPEMGHELIVIAPGDTDSVREIRDGAILHTIAARKLPVDHRYHYFDSEERLLPLLSQWNPDHVEASSPWSSASMVARWNRSASRSLVMHADPLASYPYRWFGGMVSTDRIDRWFDRFWKHLRRLDRDYDVVVSASESLTRRLRHGGLKRVTTIPMGVEPGVFSPSLRSATIREQWLDRLGLPASGRLLLAIGRMAGEKRWPMVIRAVERAAKTAPVGLLLVGDGSQAPRIERMMRSHPHTAFLGPIRERKELAQLMSSGDALVHGCESETFCLVASEARASGLPLIVPDRGGAFDQLHPGGGLSYRSGDEQSLSEAIVRFAGADVPPTSPRKTGSVRTMDQHFLELFGLYLLGLPLVDQLGDLANQLGVLAGLG